MWPPVISMSGPGWLCVFAAALSAGSVLAETTVYGKVGYEINLRPDAGSVINGIRNVFWKAGPDIAIEWDGKEMESYRQFQDRGHLNTSNGVMTITGLMLNDSGVYTPEINNLEGTPIRLIVIFAVPVPTVSKSCDEEMTRCTLTCDGQITDAGEVIYTWKSDDTIVPGSVKNYDIDKENSSDIKEFSCEVKNQVSLESSQPISNPFITDTAPEGQLKISTGLTVFICLLTAVLLLGVFHRWKAGMWFFEKGSMPWEADFWRRQETPAARDTAESNGTTAHGQKEQSEEETPMT